MNALTANATQAYPIAPEMCCTAGNANRSHDLNSDWTCKRNAHAFALGNMRQDIERTRARIATRRSDFHRRNLIAWVANAETRFATEVGYFNADAHVCTG